MTKAYILIRVSYLLALAVAWITLAFVADYHLMIQVLIADVVATIVIFAFSVAFKIPVFTTPIGALFQWSLSAT